MLSSALLSAMVLAGPASAWAADDDPEPAPLPTAMADFNRDGLPDMAKVTIPAIGGSGAGLLTVWLGQADGSFRQTASATQLGRDPRSMVAGDFNGDGIPDLIVGDGDGSVMEFLSDGVGNLTFAGDVVRLGSVTSVAVGDLNRDGIPDVAVSDLRGNAITVLLGTGKGSFRAAWTVQLPELGKVAHVAIADFNGDGVPDLAVTGGDEDTFEVLVGNGNGSFTLSPGLSNVRNPYSHCAT